MTLSGFEKDFGGNFPILSLVSVWRQSFTYTTVTSERRRNAVAVNSGGGGGGRESRYNEYIVAVGNARSAAET